MLLVDLKSGNLTCRIAPDKGGSIYSFDYRSGGKVQPLMRPTAKGAHLITDFASWPLVPYSNRINKGRFSFGGADYEVAVEYLGPANKNSWHASHGQGWRYPWDVVRQEGKRCDLAFVLTDRRVWPSPYKAMQSFRLDDKGLTLRLSVKNTGKMPMPVGLGLHPYFPRPRGTTLQAVVGKLWEIDENTIPSRLVSTPAKYNFVTPKALDTARLDHCFEGYGGIMEIVWPGMPVKLRVTSSKNLGHFVVYTPRGKDFFCAEPVSHMPDAVNRMKKDSTTGLVVLKPGETLSADYRFEVLQAGDNQTRGKRPRNTRKANASIHRQL